MLEHISDIVQTIVKNETPAEMGVSAGAGTEAHTIVSTHEASITDSITSSGEKQGYDGYITQFLSMGHEYAIPCTELMKLTGCDTVRNLRSEIEKSRKHGSLIIASNEGYFLPTKGADGEINEIGYAELKSFYSRMRSIAIGIFTSIKHIRLAIREYEREHEISERNNI